MPGASGIGVECCKCFLHGLGHAFGFRMACGGAGAVDTVVISGLLAVILAEAIGEITERIVRGSDPTDKAFEHGEIVRGGKRK